MTAAKFEAALEALVAEAGVQPDWVDTWNNPQRTTNDDLLAVLTALTGSELDTEHQIVETTAQLAAERPPIEPVIVAWDGVMPSVATEFTVTEAVIVLEDGREIPAIVDDGDMSTESTLPTGYHKLVVNGGAYTSHLFSAPTLAYPAPSRALGLISPMYSLRRSNVDSGVGSIGDFSALADVCHDTGIEVVGTLPLLATFDDEPSPYAPVSRRAWNEVFVDFSAVPGWSGEGPLAKERSMWVDYEVSGRAIRAELAKYSDHVTQTPQLRAQVDAFLKLEPEMQRYAEFRAHADRLTRNWRAWPESAEPDPERVAYHETVQWLMNKQLSELSGRLRDRGQYLYPDLPIGCHPDGFDIWDTPDLFAPASLGAPPDTLFVGGQDWGLPASIPWKAREDGHANFRKAIQRQLSVAGILRIDHVMGIHRGWWVPHGAGATQGAYVMQASDEMFAVICIESVRASASVVGENLGTVPPEITEGLSKHRLAGMAMAMSNEGVSDPESTDLLALSSHDTPAFAAWWKASDVEDLEDLGVFDEDRAAQEREAREWSIHKLRERFGTGTALATRDAVMEWMAGTGAAVTLYNLDDLLMEERRQNVPGTHWERPNWRLRHDRAVDEMALDDEFTGHLRRLSDIRDDHMD